MVDALRDTHRHIEELERIKAASSRCVMTHEAKERAKMLTERIISLSQNPDLTGPEIVRVENVVRLGGEYGKDY